MDIVNHTLKSEVDDLFFKLQDDLCSLRNKKSIVSYRGSISYEFIDELVLEIKDVIFSLGTSKEIVDKIITVLIFLNKYFKQYEFESSEKLGSLLLLKSKSEFTLVFSSALNEKGLLQIEEHLNLIKNTSEEELKLLYQEKIERKLLEGFNSNYIFDLIVVYFNSGNELLWSVNKLQDGTSILSLEVNILRK